MNDILDFIIYDLPKFVVDLGNLLFTPFVDVIEHYTDLDVPDVLHEVIGDISLIGMFSISFITIVLLFKFVALFIPN